MRWGRYESAEGGPRPPWWVGRAYYDAAISRVVCYPIPLHWIIGLARVVWWAIKRGPRLGHRFCREAHESGYAHGFVDGRRQWACPDPAAHQQSTQAAPRRRPPAEVVREYFDTIHSSPVDVNCEITGDDIRRAVNTLNEPDPPPPTERSPQ